MDEQSVKEVDFLAVKAILGSNKCFYKAENKGTHITCRFRIPPIEMSHFTLLDYTGGTKLVFNYYSIAMEEFTFLLFEKDVELFVKLNLNSYVK